MATLKEAKTEDDLKGVGVARVRDEYLKLAENYTKMLHLETLVCPKCGKWLKADSAFYMDHNYETDRYPICKRCIQKMVEQRKNDKDEPNETKESVQAVLRMMDRVYDDDFYEKCVQGAQNGLKERNRTSPFATYFTATSSLPQWYGKTWKDSIFGDDHTADDESIKVVQKTVKAARKRFGNGYSNDDYMFLENEYQNWISRYQADTKAQEDLFEMLSINKWEKRKAIHNGKSTKDLDKTYQELLSSVNILPRQNASNGITDSLTFGQLIEKWEEEEPIPEPSEEFKDVDGIGKYIRIWFKGHLARAFGLDNGYSKEYDEYIKQYTVSKPEYYEDGKSEAIYSTIFGKEEE